jgi:predicted nucleic acid-binding protein
MPAEPRSPNPSSRSGAPKSRVKKPKFVLDSHAVVALLDKEKGHERVVARLVAAQNNEIALYMSLINWGEILYTFERERGVAFADELEQDLDDYPMILMGVDRKRIRAAARLKSVYRLSYADAFAVALAQELKATVITGDPEFRTVADIVSIDWVR